MTRSHEQLLALARNATAEPDRDDDTLWLTCRECHSTMVTTLGLEPTSLCNLCAQDAAQDLGRELLRVDSVLKGLPPVVSAPIYEALKHEDRADQFIAGVLGETTRHVLGDYVNPPTPRLPGRARRKK